jgi:GPH family glycoside/pentoside/hexuronide:cation symporter
MSQAREAARRSAGLPSAAPRSVRLPSSLIWLYSAPRVGFGIMGLLFGTYLMKFATDVLLIAPAVMGALIAASRFWDAVSDPLAGYLSDRTRSPIGRRRVWMYAAAVPMGAGLVMIWSPPYALQGLGLVAWMTAALLLYETASTAFFVPHGALGVELTPDYHERTRLFGWSHMIGALGMVLGLGSLQLMNMADDKRPVALLISLAAGVSVCAIVIVSTRYLPERADYQGRGGSRPWRSFGDVLRNPHARLLLIVYAIETFGGASIGLLVPYLVEYVIPMRELMVPILIAYTIPQFALTPLWIALARRVGKKRLWVFSMVVSALGFAAIFPLTEPGPEIFLVAFMIGVSGGCGAVVAPAIQADVIDFDEYRTGERKEGAYLAVWNFVRKVSASVTAAVTGAVLQLFDFQPNAAQTEETKLALRALVALLPAGCYAIGTLVFLRFAFNESEYAAVRAAIDERS